jgi:hypothetical protein
MIVQLGNDQAMDRDKPLEGKNITTITIPEDWSVADIVRAISHPDGLWIRHSAAETPAWVEADGNPEVAQALADHYGIAIGRTKGWS